MCLIRTGSTPYEQSYNSKHLHHFITQMVYDLDGDAAALGSLEGARDIAVEAFSRFSVYLRF